uniref:Uncharacterized protein n=1 Tax=Daucus carota subsp. sativus TaxID=79200 RepID=A0A166CSS4_DAUCS
MKRKLHTRRENKTRSENKEVSTWRRKFLLVGIFFKPCTLEAQLLHRGATSLTWAQIHLAQVLVN